MYNFRFDRIRVLVVGDVMLDRYYFGSIKRISPEAPVPIVQVARVDQTLGGAGNVVNNLVHLGVRSTLIGMIGSDDNGRALREILTEMQVQHYLTEGPVPTITKIRIIGEHQQVLRLDFEEVKELDRAALDELKVSFDKCLGEADIVILSDYGKGLCSPVFCRHLIHKAAESGVPIIVDPKGNQWDKYEGAHLITPNIKELGDVVNREIKNEDDEVFQCAREIIRKYWFPYLLVTRSEKGMSLISEKDIVNFSTEAREVYDVSGAGDTVVAVLAACMAGDMSIVDAIKAANRAAGMTLPTVRLMRASRLFRNSRGRSAVRSRGWTRPSRWKSGRLAPWK